MLDATACPLADESWLHFKHKIIRLLTTPLPWYLKVCLVLLVVLLVFGVPHLVRRYRRSHQSSVQRSHPLQRTLPLRRLSAFILGLFLLSPVGLGIASQGLVAFLPADSGDPVDAIVVLGRGARLEPARVDAAIQLWQQQRAPLIFLSGRKDAVSMQKSLLQRGVPATAVDGENCSLTTAENAEFTAQLLAPRHAKRILLVTDAAHLLRSRLTFQSFGFDVTPYASSPLPKMGLRSTAMMLIQEYGGLFTYALQGRFFPRTAVLSVSDRPLPPLRTLFGQFFSLQPYPFFSGNL